MNQLQSQLLGLALGLTTAIGCIFYEKLVHNFSYLSFLVVLSVEVLVLWVVGLVIFPNELEQDCFKFISDGKYLIWAGVYVLTGVTSILWYVITIDSGVMVGSIYEVKYIVMLALLYLLFGDTKFTVDTAIGVGLALGSIYFISKN